MGAQIAELVGGLALLVIELLMVWAILETGCKIFFKLHEREKKGE
jgi:hypothetical protein